MYLHWVPARAGQYLMVFGAVHGRVSAAMKTFNRELRVVKIKLHRKLFTCLWAAFELVASHASAVGARVVIEWPRHCDSWRQPRYGLVAIQGVSAGKLILKP